MREIKKRRNYLPLRRGEITNSITEFGNEYRQFLVGTRNQKPVMNIDNDIKKLSVKPTIPNDILYQLESFAKEMNLDIDIVVRNYEQILKYFDGPLKYFHSLTEFQEHFFRKNRKKYSGEEKWRKKKKQKNQHWKTSK